MCYHKDKIRNFQGITQEVPRHAAREKGIGNPDVGKCHRAIRRTADSHTGGGIIQKPLQLFLVLTYSGEKGIPRGDLLDMFYGRGECVNPSGDLRITVYRLRKKLQRFGLLDHAEIVTEGGVYRWTGDLAVHIDAVEFERLAMQGLETDDFDMMRSACELYGGDFLSALSGEKWVATIQIRLQELYFRCLRRVFEEMKNRRDYGELLKLLTAACEMYPYEECQTMKIDCLVAMGRYKEATALYKDVTARYFEEGYEPSEKILEKFRIMNGRICYANGRIDEIVEELTENQKSPGAYCCGYPAFLDCYRMIMRMEEDIYIWHSLLCCELLDGKSHPLEADDTDANEAIRQIFAQMLRRQDLYTRYSPSQYLVLLNGMDQYEAAHLGVEIEAAYRKNRKDRRTKLRCQVINENK